MSQEYFGSFIRPRVTFSPHSIDRIKRKYHGSGYFMCFSGSVQMIPLLHLTLSHLLKQANCVVNSSQAALLIACSGHILTGKGDILEKFQVAV